MVPVLLTYRKSTRSKMDVCKYVMNTVKQHTKRIPDQYHDVTSTPLVLGGARNDTHTESIIFNIKFYSKMKGNSKLLVEGFH